MNKKIVLIIVVVALIAVGGIGYFVGQQSNAPVAVDTQSPAVEQQKEETKTPVQQIAQVENTGEELTLDELSEEQIDIFKSVAHEFVDSVLDGEMTVKEMEEGQAFIIEDCYVASAMLPQNGAKLFGEWKESVDYYELLAEWLVNNGLSGVEDIMPSIPTDEEVNETQQQETVVTPQQNKPQSSEKQQQIQIEESQTKPLNPPAPDMTEEEFIKQNEANAENAESRTESVDVMGDGFNAALTSEANRIAKQQGISFEEALAKVKADWGY